MLLTTHSPISGVSAKKNAGVVVYGGNIPASDKVIVTSYEAVSSFPKLNYITSGSSSGLYTQSGINGGTLAQNDRDDAIIYNTQKADLGGVSKPLLMQSPVADTFSRAPNLTVSGSVVLTPSGWSYTTGQPIAAQVVTGETYSSSALDADAATGAGLWVQNQGGLIPVTGVNPARS